MKRTIYEKKKKEDKFETLRQSTYCSLY